MGRSILISILALCTSMNLSCVVEGVEDEEQLAILKDLGCDCFQGFLFARAMPIGALLAWLADRDPRVETPALASGRPG